MPDKWDRMSDDEVDAETERMSAEIFGKLSSILRPSANHSPGTARSDDYGGGTHPIRGTGGPTEDNYVRKTPLAESPRKARPQQAEPPPSGPNKGQTWDPMTKLGNASKSRQERMRRD